MRSRLFKYLLVCVCVCSPVGALATNYYISPAGSDSHSGSSSSPWATFQHSNSVIQPGDTVYALAGTYNECVKLTKAGIASQRIVYQGASNFGSKIVCASGETAFDVGNSSDIGTDYITVNGFDVTATGNTCTGIRGAGSYDIIQGNRIHDIPAPISSCGNGHGGGGIETGIHGPPANTTGIRVIGNIIDGVGVATNNYLSHGIYVATPGVTIQNNVISRAAGWGIQLYHQAMQTNVSNNVSINNGSGGIEIGGADGYTVDSVTVANNIVANNGSNRNENGIEERYGPTGSNNIYRNNLLIGNHSSNFNFAEGSRTTSGNLCDTSGTGCQTIISSAQANLASIFVNYTGNARTGDYHLKAGAVAIDKGSSSGCVSTVPVSCIAGSDFDGHGRVGLIDIGAYEYGSLGSVPPPAPAPNPSLGAAVVISQMSLSFGGQKLSTPSATQFVTFKNSGSAQIDFGFNGMSVDFAFAGVGTCGPHLPVGQSCTMSVKFTPSVSGVRLGQLTVNDNTPTSPHVINLSGTGLSAAPPAGAPFRVGETNILSSSDGNNANKLFAQKIALSQPGVIQSLSFYVVTASGNLQLAIYDASGASGGPGAYLAQTGPFTPVAGWNTKAVTSKVSLPAGTYWLTYLASSSSLSFRQTSSGAYAGRSYPYGGLPGAWGTPTTGGAAHWSFYATMAP